MQALDRLEWAAGLAFAGDGVRIGVRSNDAAVIARVAALAPPTWRPLRSPLVDQLYSVMVHGNRQAAYQHRTYHLFAGPDRRFSSRRLGETLDVLESDLHFQQAVSARRSLYVHAGVVGWNGRAILAPGPSMSGKSSLVAALVRAGATYYSDEYAVLDAHGRVHPYPKRLALRNGPGQRRTRHWPESLGGQTGKEALPVGLIAITTYEMGARWRPRLLTPAQALLGLLQNTPLARSRTAFALRILRAAVQDATAVQSKRAEADWAAPALLRLLE